MCCMRGGQTLLFSFGQHMLCSSVCIVDQVLLMRYTNAKTVKLYFFANDEITCCSSFWIRRQEVLEGSWRRLDVSWRRIGASLRCLRGPWRHLWSALSVFGSFLSRLGGVFGGLGTSWGRLGSVLEAPWGVLKLFWERTCFFYFELLVVFN